MGWRGKMGAAVILLFVAAGLLSLVWTPWDVAMLDVAHRLAPPSLAHPFGTDQLGRDLLSMLMAGAVPSLATAGAAVLIGLAGGVPLGLLAAARPGWIDEIIARIVDLLFAFSAVLLAVLIVAVAGPGADRAAIAVGLFNVPVFARVTRATARILWPRPFVLSAQLAGKGRTRISIEHILPNIASAIVVQASLQLAMGLLAEAGLSYLGLGVQPPLASWGRMLADGQTLIGIAPLSVLLPGGAIMLTALGFVWLGDALARRDRRMSVLALDRLSVGFGGRTALDSISLTVAPGEIVALVGESGSGKSTLALASIGLLPAGARMIGEVRIEGEDLATMDVHRLGAVRGGRVGMVFQDPASALNPALTIGRQIGEVLALHTDLDRLGVRQQIVELLDRVGLDVSPDRHPHSLSGGQRQRVAIAMGVAARPALLIADEPTAALDPIAQRRIVDLLVGLVRERGMGLLLVTHDLALAGEIADRIAVLSHGRLVEEGEAKGLLAAPQSAELRAQIDAAQTPPAPWPRRESATLISADALSRVYRGTPALVAAHFAIRRGETLGVIGESGSGKSTLARLVLALDRPDAGALAIDGQPYPAVSRRALYRQMQAVFQDPATSFDPRWTVGRIVAEPLNLLDARPTPAERDARVASALAAVGLPDDAAARRPHEFSGGQRQRIAIARALILRPALVVLDEALSALDSRVRREILTLLIRLQAEHGLAYLFVSHDMKLVRAIADRVIALHDGRIIAEGDAREMLDAPTNPYLAALVAAQPTLS